jgi:hypothetical protein
LFPAVIVIQPVLLVAVHVQAPGAETSMVPEPPPLPNEGDVGLTVYVQGGGGGDDEPACDTATWRPATENVAPRPLESGFAATVYVTVPLPEPFLEEVIVIQLAVVATIHAHPPGAVTVTVPDPPLLSNEAVVGLTTYVQGGGGGEDEPACDTFTTWPATVSVAPRPLDVGFAAMV